MRLFLSGSDRLRTSRFAMIFKTNRERMDGKATSANLNCVMAFNLREVFYLPFSIG